MDALLPAIGWLAFVLFLGAFSLAVRFWRRHLLSVPAPDFLRVGQSSPLTAVADVLTTVLVAADALLVLGYPGAGLALAVLTAASILALGSLRANLIFTGLTGLVFGHTVARRTLTFFEDLHADWRPRRLAAAFGLGMLTATLEFVALMILVLSLGGSVFIGAALALAGRLAIAATGFRQSASSAEIAEPVLLRPEGVTLPDEDLAA